ncbi:MAG: hypothetical protein IKI93_06925 [Clostridia bacterium]|nr:hypothetical protein [Clostridia bacterium]
MKNNEKMIRWLLDAIDTEIAKPDGEADMALVEVCTALLGELNGTACTLSERELEKRCWEITRGKAVGSKSVKKRVRMVAAVAACLAAFVVISGCGYLPSITTVLQTLFASGIGKDVEVHEVTYTYNGEIVQYNNIDILISSEKLDILIPTYLPNNIHITKVLNNPENNEMYILFNDPTFSIQIFTHKTIEEHINISACDKYISQQNEIYIKRLSEASYIAYFENGNNVYTIEYTDTNTILQIFNNMR